MRMMSGVSKLVRGQSYWEVILETGQIYSELAMDWQELVQQGLLAHVQQIVLHTPVGDARLDISRPYSVFQLKCGTCSLFTGARLVQAQIIGRVENAQGLCVAMIWDVSVQHLYDNVATNVHHFKAWRPGVLPIGAIAQDAVGIKL